MNRHCSSHFDPTPPGPPCTPWDECHCAGLRPFLEPSDPEEILINTIVAELKKQHTVKVNWTPALARKLGNLYGHSRRGRCWYYANVHLTTTGVTVLFRQLHIRKTIWEANFDLLLKHPLSEKSLILSPLAGFVEGLGLDSQCRCSSCVIKGVAELRADTIACPATDCTQIISVYHLKRHWQQHCFVNGLHHCDTPGCSHKSKRRGDLERHIRTSHCLDAKKYSCSFPGCERGGDNGFPRKDKLKDHFENIHRGVGIPPKQPRTLVPKK